MCLNQAFSLSDVTVFICYTHNEGTERGDESKALSTVPGTEVLNAPVAGFIILVIVLAIVSALGGV